MDHKFYILDPDAQLLSHTIENCFLHHRSDTKQGNFPQSLLPDQKKSPQKHGRLELPLLKGFPAIYEKYLEIVLLWEPHKHSPAKVQSLLSFTYQVSSLLNIPHQR